MSKHTVLVATDNSTVVAYINKQGGTLDGDVCSPVEDHHLVSSLPGNPKSQAHSSVCRNVMDYLLSRSNQVQTTEWSLHPQVFKQICQKWFTPHIDLFATHLNHKVHLYVSPVPYQHTWAIDALNMVESHCLCLPSHSPLQGH